MNKLNHYWNNWIDRYTGSTAYWYVPKGRSISPDNLPIIQKQLRVLRRFEGKNWRDNQQKYLQKLRSRGLSDAVARDPDNSGTPMSRMLKQVLTTLGFAWIDSNDAITITPAGEKFASSRSPQRNVATQSQRYQIWNPMMNVEYASHIGLQPVPYLIAVLQRVQTINIDEYNLFCAKSRDVGDMDDSIEGIRKWRSLGPKAQHLVKEQLQEALIGPEYSSNFRRTSIYRTVVLNSSYARNFWCASGLIGLDNHGAMMIQRGEVKHAHRVVDNWRRYGYYIVFQSQKDWIATYGDPDRLFTRQTALQYYRDSSQFSMIEQTLKDTPEYTPEERREFISAAIREKVLEDILEQNIELVEPGMSLLHRQLSTEVGRIDLFARDKVGRYTIIELKKGKTDDEVFGQVSRYMGWCKKAKSGNSAVRGIIIARNIGRKLWAAVDAHDSLVDLKEYDLQMIIEDARRS